MRLRYTIYAMISGKKSTSCSLLALCVLALSAAVVADTVVMESGKTYTGRAERQGETVRIEMEHGTIDVPAEEVLYIIPSEEQDEEPDSEPTAPDGAADGTATRYTGNTAADATRPEPMLFVLMRRLQNTPAGTESYSLRRQIRQFQIMAHDRKRKVGGQWVDPDYFKRAREAFAETLDEANELDRSIGRVRGDTPADEAERLRIRQQAATRYRSAARQWPDPLLQKFLMGVAELYAGNHSRAESFFDACIAELPQVAGFHQGRTLALQGARRYDEALRAAMDTLRLQPESPQALALVAGAMENIPGAETDRPPYTDAREMLEEYEDVDETVSRASREMRWLMPGLRRDWNVRSETSMPELPYDRLYVRQAVAVPVAEQFVLVDAEVVEGAEEVFLQTADGRLFGCDAARISTFGQQSLPPLRVLAVADASFTPADVAEAVVEDQDLTVRACDAFGQMSSDVREFRTRIKGENDTLKPTVELLPGESGSPVLTDDGKLAAFLTGRTDPAEDNGGPGRVVPPDEIRELLDASRMRIRRGGFGFGHSVAKRNAEPVALEGQAFVVMGLFGEKFE
ncbi:MAG: hypothetical protein ACP5HU_04355 [Phycisphaerae bacterium]